MENVISAVFKVESEGYQALTELRQSPLAENTAVSQAALVKKGNGLQVLDSFDSGIETGDDTLIGGLVGAFVGILGGPIGMLFSGSMGALIGSAFDAGDGVRSASIIEKVSEQLVDGEVAIIALVQEDTAGAFSQRLSAYETSAIVTEDAAEVMEEIQRATEIQKDMEKQARRKLREEKREDWKQTLEERRAKLQENFDNFRKKVQDSVQGQS